MPRIKKLLQTGRSEPGSPRFDWSPGSITVVFPSGRKQLVRYRLDETHVHLTSTVLGSARARGYGVEALASTVLHRNRQAELTGFRLGVDDRLEAWCSVPLAPLSPPEARFLLHTFACEADSLEAALVREDLG